MAAFRLKGATFAIIASLAPFALRAQGVYYASNQAGMAFEEIPEFRLGEFDFSLEAISAGNIEKRIVRSRNGEEFRRWEYGRGPNGRIDTISLFDSGRLSSVERYLSSGRMSQDEEYGPDGLESTTSYSYSRKRLTQSQKRDAAGAVLFTDTYRYALSGSLREVSREYPDGQVQSAGADLAEGRLADRWYSQGAGNVFERFDASGALAQKETWQADQPLTVDTTDRKDGVAAKQVIADSQRKVRIERAFDQSGRLTSEVTSAEDSKVLSRTEYAYDDKGRIAKKGFASGGKKGIVLYSYGPGGNKAQEDHSENGTLVKRVLFESESAYTEELYDGGKVAVRVYWKDGWKRKEEIIKDGKVVRSREFK